MTPWSIRARLTAWFASVLGIVLALLAATTWWALQRSYAATIDENLASRVAAIGRFLDQPGNSAVSEELKDDLREYVALDPGWDLIRILDPTGRELYRSAALDARELLAAPLGETSVRGVYRNLIINGRPLRMLTARVLARQQFCTVQIAVPTGEWMQVLRRFAWAWLVLIPGGMLAAAAGGYWISRRALGPVDHIAGAARAITAERLDSRLDVPHTGDELQRLSETLNEMLDRLEAAFRETARFTSDASHELRTPVSLIRTSAEVALRRPRSAEGYRRALEEILGEAERASALVHDLLTLSRADAGVEGLRRTRVDLRVLVEASGGQVAALCESRGLAFQVDLPQHQVFVNGDRAALGRLILILADNAVKYTPAPGVVRIALQIAGPETVLEVRDTGIGIGAEDLPHVFDRFYRADKARSRDAGGAGLGLSIARWVVEQHGGHIRIQSAPGEGCTVQVRIPAVEGQGMTADDSAPMAAPAGTA